MSLMKTTTKTGLSKTVLVKTTKDGSAFCSFRTLTNGTVRVYSYCTWSDYTVDHTVSRDEARSVWARLVGEGYAVHTDDRCSFLPIRIECAA